jgi:hypothetical protein
VKVATPLALRMPVPILLPSDLKMTVPVGAAVPEVVTVAVQVTGSPKTDGFRLEASEVEVMLRGFGVIATPTGAVPTATVALTVFVAVSITETELEPKQAT